jgi:ABC-type proline/glycine betaine transport system permease subunit
MPRNMGVLDRGLRTFVVAPVAIAVAFVIGAGTVGGIILFVVAGIMLATSSTGYCPNYILIGISTDPRVHRVERTNLHLGHHLRGGHA